MFSFGRKEEPEIADVIAQQDRRPSHADVVVQRGQSVSNNRGLTGASALTVKQSIIPITLVTVLFFLWGFAYGLLDGTSPRCCQSVLYLANFFFQSLIQNSRPLSISLRLVLEGFKVLTLVPISLGH